MTFCFLRIVAVVQSFIHTRLFATPWTAARQASLSFTISQNLLILMSIESVILSKHLVLCHPFSSCLQSFPASGKVCCHSVAKLCLTLYNPMDSSMQAPLSFIISQSLLKFMSVESVVLSNHFILCCPLL